MLHDSPTDDAKAHLKAPILQAVRALFAEKDYDAIGIRLICETAGIGNSSLFHAFGGKRAVAVELYAAACQRRDQVVATALAAFPDDAQKAIKQVVDQVASFVTSPETDVLLLRRLRSAVADTERFRDDPDGLAELVPVIDVWLARMAADKQVASLPPALVTTLLLAPAHALAEFKTDQPAAADEMIDELAERVWNALRPAPASRPSHPARAPQPSKLKTPAPTQTNLFDSPTEDQP